MVGNRFCLVDHGHEEVVSFLLSHMPGIGKLTGQGSQQDIVVMIHDNDGRDTPVDHVTIPFDDVHVFIRFASINFHINKIFFYQLP